MDTIDLLPPQKILHLSMMLNSAKEYIYQIISLFPKEFTLAKDLEDKILLVYRPINAVTKTYNQSAIKSYTTTQTSQGKTFLIEIVLTTDYVASTDMKIEIGNEGGNIANFNELKDAEKYLSLFISLFNKAVDNTLRTTVNNINKKAKKELGNKAFIQLVYAVLIGISIFLCLKILFGF